MNKILLFIKTNSLSDLLIHLGIVISLTLIGFMVFFNSFLPSVTYHRETVTVPDVTGMSVAEIKDFLETRDLSFEIKDSTYSSKHKPFVVLSQSPIPGAKVKRYRKLFLTVNPQKPPLVKMPNLIDMPFSEAMRALRNEGLEYGRVKYVPHIGENVVLEQIILDRTYGTDDIAAIKAGIKIPKGSRVDLVVGDGLGEREFPVPDLVMMPLDEAEFVIKGHELVRGTITYNYNSNREIGTVISQNPPVYIGRAKDGVKPGSAMDNRKRNLVRAGEIIDLVVSGNPAARPEDEEKLTPEERRRRDSLEQNYNIRRQEEIEKIRKKRLGIEEKEGGEKKENEEKKEKEQQ